jgi:Carboxypeptidase regulatory-like domain
VEFQQSAGRTARKGLKGAPRARAEARRRGIGPAVALLTLLVANLALSQGLNTVTGTVIDAVTHETVLDVKVTATSPQLQAQRSSITHSTGVYRIRELPLGTYSLQFVRDGYKPLTREGVRMLNDETLRVDVQLIPAPPVPDTGLAAVRNGRAFGPASSVRTVDPQDPGLSTLSGTVVDASSKEPLSDVAVTAMSPQLRGQRTVVTPSTGVYQIPELLPGTYLLRFERDKYRSNSLRSVTVAAGQVLRVDVQLALETVDVVATQPAVDAPSPFRETVPVAPAGANNSGLRSFSGLTPIAEAIPSEAQGSGVSTVAGTVVDASTGARLRGVLVIATSPQPQVEEAVVTLPTGDYRFRKLPPGTYSLRFEKAPYKPEVRNGLVLASDQGLLLDVQLVLDELGPPEAGGR